MRSDRSQGAAKREGDFALAPRVRTSVAGGDRSIVVCPSVEVVSAGTRRFPSFLPVRSFSTLAVPHGPSSRELPRIPAGSHDDTPAPRGGAPLCKANC